MSADPREVARIIAQQRRDREHAGWDTDDEVEAFEMVLERWRLNAAEYVADDEPDERLSEAAGVELGTHERCTECGHVQTGQSGQCRECGECSTVTGDEVQS